MRYISTRGQAEALDFEDVVLAGLARDGGLYVPQTWPIFEAEAIEAMAGLSYPELAATVIRPFVAGSEIEGRLDTLVADSYAVPSVFHHTAITPLYEMRTGHWLLELFHGPTLAFKDVALQLLGRLFEDILARRGTRMTVVGATSGDTGSAAIEACSGRENVDIFMLHPAGRVSDVQRRQMTTVSAPNVFNLAIEGNFDDCQELVKSLFNDHTFRDKHHLGAVNSINWARVMAQVVYYFHAVLSLGGHLGRPIQFSVPTGNFGDVYAGYVAQRIGLPIDRLIIATNVNDILHRALNQGDYSRHEVVSTLSPSMDIQVSSNFERLLFDLNDHDGDALMRQMNAFAASGRLEIGEDVLARARRVFSSCRVDEAQTLERISSVFRETGKLIDPHTAVGMDAADRTLPGRLGAASVVTLATAHPAKFPDGVEKATGVRPALPVHLADLMGRAEHFSTLPCDLAALKKFIDEARP